MPWTAADRNALARLASALPDQARAVGVETGDYVHDRRATAATLRSIDAAAGGGFYAVPPDAEIDAASADAAFAGDGAPLVDVQTHLVRPSRMQGPHAAALTGFLRMTDPTRWAEGIDPDRLAAAEWAAQVFGASETAVAVLTSTPGGDHDGVLTNEDIGAAREVVDRYAGTGRVLTHSIVHPNIDGEIERMDGWSAALRPDGWKTYPLWAPPGADGRRLVPRRRHGHRVPRTGARARPAASRGAQGDRRTDPGERARGRVTARRRPGRARLSRHHVPHLPLGLRAGSRRRGGSLRRRVADARHRSPGREPARRGRRSRVRTSTPSSAARGS